MANSDKIEKKNIPNPVVFVPKKPQLGQFKQMPMRKIEYQGARHRG